MGIVVPRPALRARGSRIIRHRLDYFDRRLRELLQENMPADLARAKAYGEACRLQFDRRGNLKGTQ